MVYNINQIIAYIKLTGWWELTLTLLLLFILIYGLLMASGVFSSNHKIPLVLSILFSAIATTNPLSQKIVFSLIPDVTTGVLVVFGALMLFYMVFKAPQNIFGNEINSNTLTKVKRYIFYGVLGFVLVYIIISINNAGIVSLNRIIPYLKPLVVIALLGTGLWFIIIKPIAERHQSQKTLKNISTSAEEIHKAKLRATEELIDKLMKKGLSPQEASYIAAEIEKSKHHH